MAAEEPEAVSNPESTNEAPTPAVTASPKDTIFQQIPSLWPPTQRTRDAVVARLVETMTSPGSFLAQRYGAIPDADAAGLAASIEADALAAASAAAGDAKAASIDEGIETLQLYSKEVSRRLLEIAKARAKDSKTAAAAEEEKKEKEEAEEKKGKSVVESAVTE